MRLSKRCCKIKFVPAESYDFQDVSLGACRDLRFAALRSVGVCRLGSVVP